MELVDRYVEAVGAELPRRLRADVARELAGLLAESVEERVAAGAPLRQAQLDVLREFGSPAAAAERYTGPRRALIGHDLLPALWKTLGIVAVVLGGLSLAAWLWQAVGEVDPAAALLRALPEIFSQWLSNFLEVAGLVLLVFAAVEWLGLRRRESEAAWDPALLEAPPPEAERVSRWGALAGAATLLFLILWVLFFTDSVAARVATGTGGWASVPLVGPGLERCLPWLVAVWSAELVVQAGLLLGGRWSVPWRLVDLGTRLLGLAVLALVVASREPLLATTAAEAVAVGVRPDLAERLAAELLPMLDRLLRLGLVVALVGSAIGVVRRVRRLVSARPSAASA